MTQRHKHADLIIAWANGAVIQEYNYLHKRWQDCRSPDWDVRFRYRIKPIPRYLPVTVGNHIFPTWWDTKDDLSRWRACETIGYIEDLQDGSTPTFHYWEKQT